MCQENSFSDDTQVYCVLFPQITRLIHAIVIASLLLSGISPAVTRAAPLAAQMASDDEPAAATSTIPAPSPTPLNTETPTPTPTATPIPEASPTPQASDPLAQPTIDVTYPGELPDASQALTLTVGADLFSATPGGLLSLGWTAYNLPAVRGELIMAISASPGIRATGGEYDPLSATYRFPLERNTGRIPWQIPADLPGPYTFTLRLESDGQAWITRTLSIPESGLTRLGVEGGAASGLEGRVSARFPAGSEALDVRIRPPIPANRPPRSLERPALRDRRPGTGERRWSSTASTRRWSSKRHIPAAATPSCTTSTRIASNGAPCPRSTTGRPGCCAPGATT